MTMPVSSCTRRWPLPARPGTGDQGIGVVCGQFAAGLARLVAVLENVSTLQWKWLTLHL